MQSYPSNITHITMTTTSSPEFVIEMLLETLSRILKKKSLKTKREKKVKIHPLYKIQELKTILEI